MPTPEEVLGFWFDPAAEVHWFDRDNAFDAHVRERFGAALKAAADGELDGWSATPEGWLALLIVLDQFSRNIYRDDARAWAYDAKAQALALAGIARGDDQRLAPLRRLFAYLPLEHAENLALQRHCVQLFERLVDPLPAGQRAQFENFLDYARRHHDVIERFGRFPHRNAVLGRPDTDAEQAYLAQPGSGF
ncbi:DUF924 domain-containing protein [Dyella jiangningensis]|uniref:DUF924 family protein n=1 Tax=Dyella jiangningensis TaxID=1379159 RepID=UPI00240FBE47|nr:DUF924 family protein [Dyella jiangningensis]MDG2540027.1 DUF924 domain-containing protein [Dyella jiangningensis]